MAHRIVITKAANPALSVGRCRVVAHNAGRPREYWFDDVEWQRILDGRTAKLGVWQSQGKALVQMYEIREIISATELRGTLVDVKA